MERTSAWSGVLRALYTHNPFYLLSACLMLYGLQAVFHPPEGELINPWAMLASLCAYSALVAVTAFLIVHFGKVWEDARSLVLVLLLLFFALSVSFDEIFNTSVNSAYGLLAFGLSFSVLVSEGLCRGLKIRFPFAYRGPYYALLVLLFAYPVFVSGEVTGLESTAIHWRIFLFSPAAGALFLLLIPAIRRGAEIVRENGTPWRWPWFPWTAFAFLAFGVCVRSYVLSVSFSPERGYTSAFGPYFLVPILLPLVVLLLEVGVVEHKPFVRRLALLAAPVLLLFAVPQSGGSDPHRTFLAEFVTSAGSPLFLALLGLLAFYAYAWHRGAATAEFGVTAALGMACVVGPDTIDGRTLMFPAPWPLATLAAIQFFAAVKRGHSARWLAGAVCTIAAATVTWRGTPFTAYGGAVPLHLVLGAALTIGVLGRDPFALMLRRGCAIALPLLGLAALVAPAFMIVPDPVRLGYAAFLTGLCCLVWRVLRDPWFLAAFGANAVSAGGTAMWTLHDLWGRSSAARGFLPLIWGLVCFAVAVLISALKAARAARLRN
jgi:hypothetical protein